MMLNISNVSQHYVKQTNTEETKHCDLLGYINSNILTLLILPTYEYGLSSHLFLSSISFTNVLFFPTIS